MIIQCTSCEKKFTVPDSAITIKGRLVQCSACGNKWTQYPIKKNLEKTTKLTKNLKTVKQKKKKQKIANVYTEEYLQKKHGIKIIDPSSLSLKANKGKKSKNVVKTSFGFYSYLVTFVVIILALFGALNLTKDIIIYNYPFLEIYINHLYETLNNLNLIISDFLSSY